MAIPSNRPQNRILLVGGIIFALLAAGVVYLAVSKSSGSPGNAGATVPVVVANQDILAGTTIAATELTLQQYAPGSEPTGFFTSTSQVVGQTASQNIVKGATLTQSMLGIPSPAGGGTLNATPSAPLLIADGYAALAIPTHLSTADTTVDQMSVGYYVLAGAQIDILAQVPVPPQTDTVQFGYLFQDIPVLAVGYSTPSASASPAAAATLQAPAYFVVEMPDSEAVEMSAILTGKLAAVTGGSTGLVLKYVLRPRDAYGTFSKPVTKNGITSVTFNPVKLANVPTVTLPGSPLG